jgi:hypothetical protein
MGEIRERTIGQRHLGRAHLRPHQIGRVLPIKCAARCCPKNHHNQIKSVEQGSSRHCPTGTPPQATEKERGTEGKGTHRWSPGGARPRRGCRRRARAARAPTRGAAAGPPPGTAGGPAPPPLPWPSRPLPGLSNRRK